MASTATRTPRSVLSSVAAERGSAAWVPGVAGGAAGAARRLRRDGEAALVVAAVRADVMRELRLVAVRTLLELRQTDRQVRAALTLACVRHASLRHTHWVVVLLVVRMRVAA